MKKTVSLLIALVMMVALAVPAFAEESTPAEPYAVCKHIYGPRKVAVIGWEYVDSQHCQEVLQYSQTCTKCGYIQTYSGRGDTLMHDRTLYRATCDGYEQTWYYRCDRCGHSGDYEHRRCPGARHSPGSCRWLPI